MSSATTKSKSLARSRRGVGADVPAAPCRFANRGTSSATPRPIKPVGIVYQRDKGVDAYVRAVARATPMEMVAIERQGVLATFIMDLSTRMELPPSWIFSALGMPSATAETRPAAGEFVGGSAGQNAVGLIKLLGIAQDLVSNSIVPEAEQFDVAKWFGKWIALPQPALGGLKPAQLLDTPTGVKIVARLLGAIESGAYQ